MNKEGQRLLEEIHDEYNKLMKNFRRFKNTDNPIDRLEFFGDAYSDIFVWLKSLNKLIEDCLDNDFGDTFYRYMLSYIMSFEDGTVEAETMFEAVQHLSEIIHQNKGKEISIKFEVEDELHK